MSNLENLTSKACCTIPPVLSDYTPKGTKQPFYGLNTVYVTGPETSDNAIVCVFDVFGFFPQTQQGADMIASSLNTRVFMPDFFDPEKPFDVNRFPPKCDDDRAELSGFFSTTGKPQKAINKLRRFVEALKADNYKRIGVYGFCWGSKIAISVGSEALVNAVGMIHPAMLFTEDIKKATVPIAIYISMDESESEYNNIVKVLAENDYSDKNDNKYYKNMFHGFAAARANLKNEENKKEFEDVYSRLINFFANTLN